MWFDTPQSKPQFRGEVNVIKIDLGLNVDKTRSHETSKLSFEKIWYTLSQLSWKFRF